MYEKYSTKNNLIIIPGTFNPVTNAHIQMGINASAFVGGNTLVVYVPSSPAFMKGWGKDSDRFMTAGERYEVLNAALAALPDEYKRDDGYCWFIADNCEISGRTDGKTINTVKYLSRADKYDNVYLCLGDDKLDELPNWYQAESLFDMVHTLVFTRNKSLETLKESTRTFFKGKKLDFLCMDMPSVSSTAVRTAVYENRLDDIKDMIPKAVYEALREKQFNVAQTTDKLIRWLQSWFEENGKDCNAVLGISGGKDSTVAAAVCVAALGKDRVIGVLMPDGEQKDISDSYKVCEHLGIRRFEVNIHDAVEGVYNGLKTVEDDGVELTAQTRINLPPRIRMATLYAVSQSVNGRVINTCNLSEDWVGYSTRYGDSVGDVSPLSNLTVKEVKMIGKYLGVPTELIDKTPSDGLCGKTDEDNLGFTYTELDRYIRTGDCVNKEVKAIIDRKRKANMFKLLPMPSFLYTNLKL